MLPKRRNRRDILTGFWINRDRVLFEMYLINFLEWQSAHSIQAHSYRISLANTALQPGAKDAHRGLEYKRRLNPIYPGKRRLNPISYPYLPKNKHSAMDRLFSFMLQIINLLFDILARDLIVLTQYLIRT